MYCIVCCLLLIASKALSVAANLTVVTFGDKLTIVYCDNTVPRTEHVEHLDNNKYSFLPTNSSSGEKTKSIEFMGCKFPQIPQKFLQQFPIVRKIDFSSRGIQSIKNDDFLDNIDLVILRAEHNCLTELPANLFNNTPNIEEVYFSHNIIEKIDPNCFAEGVKHLWKIDFRSNRIKTVDGRLLRNAVSLRNIDFALNVIEYFGVKSLKFEFIDDILEESEHLYAERNCIILPYKTQKTVSIDVFQLFVKNDELFSLPNVELNCNRENDNKTFYLREDLSKNVDGITLVINV